MIYRRSIIQQIKMSLDQIRRFHLLKSLQHSRRDHHQSQIKKKLSNSMSISQNARKLNKNKKYMLEQERNTQIQRDNRMLYEKIMNNFKSLEESKSIIQSRNRWRKNKHKPFNIRNTTVFKKQDQSHEQLKYLSRINNVKHTELNIKTLFYGNDEIDGIPFKIKLILGSEYYYLFAKNHEVQIKMQMAQGDYMKLHNHELKGNPCNIFKYLEIIGQNVVFRSKNKIFSDKLDSIL